MSSPIRLATAQTKAVIGDIEKNANHHCDFVKQAIAEGAHAVIFPELSLSGYTLRDLNIEVALDAAADPRLAELRSLSNNITIICGGVERALSGGVHNAAFVFEGGELIHTHRKIYPPTYGIFEEQRYFLAGNKALAFESKRLGKIGVLVCEDLWHPSLPYLLTYQGAQSIITIAASPTRIESGSNAEPSVPGNYTINKEHHVAYARLFSVFIAFCNRVGVEDGVNFWGGSELVDPSGNVIMHGKFFEEDLAIGEMDYSAIAKARQFSRHMLDEDLLLTRELFDETIARNRRQ